MNKIIKSPLSGTIIPLEEVPDEVFAQKILGDGVAIIPDEGIAEAPLDGLVGAFPESGHACGIKTQEGYEILIHIGIDTVEMKGKGFKAFVRQGENIKTGQKIMEFDLNQIQEAGKRLESPVIIIGPRVKIINSGKIKRGEALMEINE